MKTMSPKAPASAKSEVKAATKTGPSGGGSPRQNMGAAPAAPTMARRVKPAMGPAMGKTPQKPSMAKGPTP